MEPSSENDPSKKNSNESKNRPDDFRYNRSPQKDDILSFMKENTRDTIAYVLIIASIMMLFFDSVAMYGGLILGIIFGLYFAKELAYLVSNASSLIEENGIAKSLIFGIVLLILLIKAPFVFIGAAIVAVLKLFFADDIQKL